MKIRCTLIFVLLQACAANQSYGDSNLHYATSEVSEFISRIDFTTESGNQVILGMTKYRLSDVQVIIHGKAVQIPKASYEDLSVPLLERATLSSSTGVNGNQSVTTYSLEFPLMDQNNLNQKDDEMNVVIFVIENGALSKREIWDKHNRAKLLSSIQY